MHNKWGCDPGGLHPLFDMLQYESFRPFVRLHLLGGARIWSFVCHLNLTVKSGYGFESFAEPVRYSLSKGHLDVYDAGWAD